MSEQLLSTLALHLLSWNRNSLRRLIWKKNLGWQELLEILPQVSHKIGFDCNFKADEYLRLAEKELTLAQKNGIQIVDQQSPFYPPQYREIAFPPLLFYYAGDLQALKRDFLAVVGSRRATAYSQRLLKKLLPDIIAADIAVVSGLAYGVDILAHRLTLELKGVTVGVNAGGLLQLYPAAHREIARQMSEQGGLLTEFPLHEKPRPYFFPLRNRLISGLAKAVLITEAASAGGSLLTARLALEQNREVLAVPGNIDSPLSRGTNELIQNGAKVVLESADILEEFGVVRLSKKRVSGDIALNENLSRLLAIIKKNGMITFDELLAVSGCSPEELLSALTELEIQELIFEDQGIIYEGKN